jgi:FixJ family two-component response regulator
MDGDHEARVTADTNKSCKSCTGPCVFVVEPGEGLRRSMQLTLGFYGYDVRAHASAEDAIAELRACDAACVITGLVLDGMSGLALVSALREKGWGGPAFVICPQLTDALQATALELGQVTLMLRSAPEHHLIRAIQKFAPASVS